jgi:hypothetical protein
MSGFAASSAEEQMADIETRNKLIVTRALDTL